VANTAVVKERQGKLDADQVGRLLHAAAQLPVQIDHEADVFRVVSPIARRWQRSAYDALYLELAQRHELPLATLDSGLRQAAQGLGIEVATFGTGGS
jgi:predicted nucleic acid-binding protein